MDFSLIKQFNERLFWDGVCRKKISYSEAGALQTGGAASFPLIEYTLGGPYTPDGSSFDPNSNNIPIGPGGSYPKPWRSASQFIQNGQYGSLIGPYARLVKIPDNINMENTCVGNIPTCGGSKGGIYGRLGIYQGQLAFRAQDWYNQSEGTYNTQYWNNQLNTDPDWLSWKSWWDSASRTTVNAVWADTLLPFTVEVEVAYDAFGPGDPKYYPAPNLSSYDDYTLPLLSVVIAVAVIGGAWL